ncbi:MAG: PEP-utilizing enzyme [Chloroflexota bacterium]|nr:PEP-utilizing enzyme [Chloroflexota bacterium]
MPIRQSNRRDQWSRANVKEILPELPSPLLMSQLEASSGPQMLAAFEVGGYRFPDGAMLFRAAGGRPYFNASLLRSMLADLGVPPELNDQAIGSGLELDRPALQWNWPRVARRLPVVLSSLARQLRAVPATERWFGRVEGTLAELSLATDRVLRRAADADLLADFERIAPELGRFFYHTVYLTAAATTHFHELARLLHGRLEAPAAAINQAVAGEGNVSADLPLALMRVAAIARAEPQARSVLASSSDLGADFRDTLRGTRTLDHFEQVLDRFGDRGLFESDSASPRYREAPGYLLGVVAQYVRDPTAPDADGAVVRQRRQAQQTRATIKQAVGRRWPYVRWRLGALRQVLVLREANRFRVVRIAAQVRRRELELGRRMVERGWLDHSDDYFWLTTAEIRRVVAPGTAPRLQDQAGGVRVGLLPRRSGVLVPGETAREPGHLRAVIAARRARYARYCAITVPDECTDLDALERFARGRDPAPPGAARRPPPTLTGFGAVSPSPPAAAPAPPSAPDRIPPPPEPLTLRGLGVSAGRAQGTARVIRQPEEFGRLQPGDILVCPATDPAWSPLFPLVRGLVVEIGGQLSHGSIVAREYSIPAVVNVPQATDRIPDGATIELDATAGTVRLIDTGQSRDGGAVPSPTTLAVIDTG